jgi:hypothetical protein
MKRTRLSSDTGAFLDWTKANLSMRPKQLPHVSGLSENRGVTAKAFTR